MNYHRKQGNTSSVTPHYKGRVVHTQELQQEWNRCPLDDVKWIKDEAARVGERHSKNDEENSLWFLVSALRCSFDRGPSKLGKESLGGAMRRGAARKNADPTRTRITAD